ncbi:MAG: Uma2 family endonuclease [Eubacterium sp.]|nr:Uma2 family endonuclease [Eubacterium sp.]
MRYNDVDSGEPLFARQEQIYKESLLNEKEKHTIADLEKLPEDRRVELVDGVFYDMAEPLIIHQNIVGEIFAQFRNHIKEKMGKCRPYVAPVGVQLFADDDRTLVEPDVFVVCDPDKQNNPKRIIGGPDLVVEVLSPSNKKYDMVIKKQMYSEAKVREYWIVDPEAHYVFVYDFENSNITYIYTFDDPIPVKIYDNDFSIDLTEFM